MIGFAIILTKAKLSDHVDFKDYPAVQEYIDRLQSRPAAKLVFDKYNELPKGSHACGSSVSS